MLRNGATVWTANDRIAYYFVRIFFIILVWNVAGLVEKKRKQLFLPNNTEYVFIGNLD